MKPQSCEGCACQSHGHDFIRPEGLGSLKVLLCGEASGENEARDQLPFRPYAAAGALLERTLRRLGLDRDQFVIANTLFCRPTNNLLEGMPYEHAAIEHCKPNLLGVIAKHKPRVLVALGNIPLRTLTGWSGEKRGVSHLRGYPLRALPEFCAAAENPDLCVVPTFHPAFLRRGAIHLSGVLARDIYRAVNIAKGKDKSFILDAPEIGDSEIAAMYASAPADEEFAETMERVRDIQQSHLSSWMQRAGLKYNLAPTPRDLDLFCRDVKARSDAWLALSPEARAASYLALSADIETRESADLDEDATDGFTDTIVEQIQFSIEPAQGISLTWDEDSQQAASWLLRLPLPKVGHNWWLFDHKVLRAVGARQGRPDRFIAKGDAFDTLQMFHYWQPDLPAHLQAAATFAQFPFPWKHLAGSNLPFYGCLAKESRLILWNGDTVRICDVVNKKMPVTIRGVSEQGEMIPVPVVGWRKIYVHKQPWLTIETDGCKQPLYLTPDHKVWVKDSIKGECWKSAADLCVGDLVKSSFPGNEDLLHGTLLGDGSVDKRGRFKFSHCAKQFDYFEAKRVAVQGPTYVKAPRENPNPGRHKPGAKPTVKSTTHYVTEFQVSAKLWRDRFYTPNGKRFIAPPSDRALAIWYCDDGTWARNTDASLGNPRFLALALINFGECLQWFRNQFGSAFVRVYNFERSKRGQTGGAVSLIGEAREKFFSRIAPYVHPCMQYKLPLSFRGQYNNWLDRVGLQWTVVNSIKTGRIKSSRYCITVDHPTHRFLTLGGLVKNCVDTDATLRVYQTVRKTMEDRGIWLDPDLSRDNAGYVSQVQRLRPILADMEDRGLPVDNTRRLALDVEFDAAATEVFRELDQRFPDEARKIDPKEGYAGVPPAVKKLLGIRAKTKPKKGAVLEEWPEPISEAEVPKVKFEKPGGKLEDGTREEGEFFCYIQQEFSGEVRWCRRYEFSPNSSQQLIRYMQAKRHKIPTKKGGAQTTEKKELERLAAKHSDNFYFKVIEYRELTKMRGTYIDGYRPHADGRVHTTFTFDTATQQTSSRNPNVQNTPKHGKLADVFRAIIRHPVKLIVEWDYKSFHVLTTGFEAKSAGYMRLARLDMHSFIAWHFMKLPGADALYSLPDSELREKLEWFKSDKKRKYIRDKQSKPAILGIGFGLGDEKFYNMNLEHFSSLAEAKKLRALIKSIFPEVFRWQDEIRELAHRQTFLKSRYGAIRWFYEVKVPDGKGGMRSGEQGEEAIAYLPASGAFGHIRAAMRELDRRGLCAKWEMVNTVHDSLVMLVHEKDLAEHIQDVYPILTAPSKVLIDPVLAPGGLSVDVEASAGVSWAKSDLRELKIPDSLVRFSLAPAH